MPVLVCKTAPAFTASAVLADGTIDPSYDLHSNLEGKYGLLFFYPLDFTFVCPTELVAIDNRINEFSSRDVVVIAISVDSVYTHLAWRNTPVDKGGIGPVGYTMVSDIKHEIAHAYDVENEGGVALRGAFLIDKKGIVRSQTVNDLPIGRNIDELLRTIDALQFHEKHGDVCPANWEKGSKGMAASDKGVSSFLSEFADEL